MIRGFNYRKQLLAYSVSNISEKQARYSFECGSVQKIHPTRTINNGTDRILITPNLIAISDFGGQTIKSNSAYLDDTFSNKLLSILKFFFHKQVNKYCANLYELVNSAVQNNKEEGSCTLTVAAMHPYTGDVSFYYIGDSLYGIFRESNVEMVEGLYDGFNYSMKLGHDAEYPASSGFVETYKKEEIKKDDVIVMASNGLWNNVDLNQIHYLIRGPGSLVEDKANYLDAVGRDKRQKKSLQEIVERLGLLAAFYSRKGNYQSPIYLKARSQNIKFPKQGFLDDISIILARRKKEIQIKRSQM